jgi:hypothetical protein
MRRLPGDHPGGEVGSTQTSGGQIGIDLPA